MQLRALPACLALMLTSSVALGGTAPPSAPYVPAPGSDTVLLLHGLGRTHLSLLPLAHALERAGFHVVNRSYPWRTRTLEELARDWLPRQVADLPPSSRLHIVTHSMGGILVRLWLRENSPPAHLGRVVMLAPPNHGSPLADRLATSRLLRLLVGPNGSRLGTTPASLPATLGPWPAAAADLGILAGDHSLLPLPATLLPPPHDGKVTVDSTRLAGAVAHRTLPLSHTLLPWRRVAHTHVIRFLRAGTF